MAITVAHSADECAGALGRFGILEVISRKASGSMRWRDTFAALGLAAVFTLFTNRFSTI